MSGSANTEQGSSVPTAGDSNGEPIRFQVTLQAEDYLRANQLNLRLRLFRRGMILAFLALWIFYSLLDLFLGGQWTGEQIIGSVTAAFPVSLAVFAAIILVSWLYLRFSSRRLFRQNKMLSTAQSISAGANGVDFSSSLGQSHIAYALLHKWAANDHLILLYPGDNLFYLLPRRCVNEEQWRGLIAFLSASACPRTGPRPSQAR